LRNWPTKQFRTPKNASLEELEKTNWSNIGTASAIYAVDVEGTATDEHLPSWNLRKIDSILKEEVHAKFVVGPVFHFLFAFRPSQNVVIFVHNDIHFCLARYCNSKLYSSPQVCDSAFKLPSV